MKYCASCRNGENKIEADYLVSGRVDGMPYRAYLCREHLEMFYDDGAELKIIEYVSEDAKNNHALEIIFEHTAYTSLDDFLANNPTLRPGTFAGVEWLRRYYTERTGQIAPR